MNRLFQLDVMEVCLLNIPEGKETATITPETISSQVKERSCREKTRTLADIKAVLREVFPIYKNNRANAKTFKISRPVLEEYLRTHGLLLRPVKDAGASAWLHG